MTEEAPRLRPVASPSRRPVRFLVGAVRYNKDRTHINRLKVHELVDNVIQPARYLLRTEVISYLRAGHGFQVVGVDEQGKMIKGPPLTIRTIYGNDYLRTDLLDRETDTVSGVPEFTQIG